MNLTSVVALMVTAVLALAGYWLTFRSNVRLAQRQSRLLRVNEQLSEFYGPLLALTQSTEIAWRAFRSRHPRDEPFWLGTNPAPSGQEDFRRWMTQVFMPSNRRLEEIVVGRADLLEDREMPEVLLVLVAHIAGFRVILERWSDGDFTDHRSVVDFPDGVRTYAAEMFGRLKSEQCRLLGVTQSSQ